MFQDVRTETASPPLLAARLDPAPVPETLIDRGRLHRLLDAGAAGPVTLVRAPAGWGKTVLLSAWRRAGGGGPAAWLTLEPADPPDRCWAYLAAALADGPPDGTAGRADLPDRLAEAVARRPEPVVLVLDDAHHAGPDLQDGLDLLLRHCRGRLRLVLGARTDPALGLHRWRLSGELTELGAAELAFTAAEAGELLAAHGVRLPADRVAELVERTEGWPAGLRLAALALRDHADPDRYAAEFDGDDPGVAGYLRSEVLGALPAADREGLRRAAVADRLSAELLATLAAPAGGAGPTGPAGGAGPTDLANGPTDPAGGAGPTSPAGGAGPIDAAGGAGPIDPGGLLVRAERTGFVVPLGTRPATWRCHRLLAGLLRSELARLPEAEVRDLHCRAAGWAVRHDRPAEGLRHALAAEDPGLARRILREHWPELVAAAPRTEPGAPAPTPPADLGADPELALAYAADRLRDRDPVAVEAVLGLIAGRSGAGPRDLDVPVILAALRLGAARLGGDAERLAGAARLLLDAAELADDPAAAAAARALAGTALGSLRLGAGDFAAAEAELAAAAGAAGRAGLARVELAATGWLALVRAVRGSLRSAGESARAALALSGGGDRSAGADCAPAYLALAMVATEQDRPADAAAHLGLADGAVDPAAEPLVAALGELARARLRAAGADLVGGFQAVQAGRRALAGRPSGLAEPALLAAEAELRAANGDLDTARSLLVPAVEAAGEPVAPALAVALARVRLLAGDPGGAARTLPDWTGPAAAGWPVPVRLAAGLLAALAARAGAGDGRPGPAGQLGQVGRIVERVLDLAEPDGYRLVFTRSNPPVRDLLAAHRDSGTAHWPMLDELLAAGDAGTAVEPAAPAALGEPLTDRELTVLRYLQSILSNVEIASELSLSVNTVKTHVRNIYRKLDARRRREAVRRARELHLI
ncbi:LuxR C-terminal-related transcriptional regulator [Plantactinospora siamensis]|uniref:LuxR C-terminal-related transcriptional regulator n=1 Tax=Plantactinospora siamensis TaxID=555372 RepID=A0ABV6P0B5_9ACTN